jgi:hypothetical protein
MEHDKTFRGNASQFFVAGCPPHTASLSERDISKYLNKWELIEEKMKAEPEE